jgi:GR25 family glycosyltransferase involved in LPS biosynthesis
MILCKKEKFNEINIQKVPILYISLPGDEKRKNYIQQQIKPLCSSGERICKLIDGVWGKDPKTGKIHKDYKDNMGSSNLTHSEFGCTMAHMNAAKYIVDNKLPYALVVEDDANFQLMPSWSKTLEQIITELPKGWTTCQLYFSGNSEKKKSGVHKKSTKDPGYGTVAYLLSAKGASIVSKIDISTYKKSLVADALMYNFSGAKPYVHYPRYIITGEMASKIHPDHDKFNKQQVENIVDEFKNNIK